MKIDATKLKKKKGKRKESEKEIEKGTETGTGKGTEKGIRTGMLTEIEKKSERRKRNESWIETERRRKVLLAWINQNPNLITGEYHLALIFAIFALMWQVFFVMFYKTA